MAKAKFKFNDQRKFKKLIRVLKKEIPATLRNSVLRDIEGGRSPVQGFGRFQKYSDSYIAQIRGKAAFRTFNGRVVPFTVDDLGFTDKEFATYKPDAQAKRRRQQAKRDSKAKIAELNKEFAFYGKRQRPVNMTFSGKMLNSFFVKTRKKSVIVGFKDKKADIHNRLGVPSNKGPVIRRLLPTKTNEKFNRSIRLDIRETLNRVAKSIFG